VILAILVFALAGGIMWARNKAGQEVCTDIDVEIANADSTVFVTNQGILNDLNTLGIKLKGRKMADINASKVEEILSKSEYLENVECVKSGNGHILLRARQLVPVMRIFDGDVSYYVNRDGKKMAATANYHADVPVVQGHFTQRFPATRLLPLLNYIEADSTLHSLVTMVSVRDSNNILIVPDIQGHVVNLGNLDNIQNKFEKLKLFYREVMPQKGWLTYDTISVKWSHQVVATRRVKAVKQELAYDPDDDEQMPDQTTMTINDEGPLLATPKKQGAQQQPKPQKTENKKPNGNNNNQN